MIQAGEQPIDFLTRQPIEGRLLSDRLAEGSLSAEEAIQIAIDLGSQLNKAHLKGMVHGALSPSAILLTATGAQVLVPPLNPDARTAAYRSPEQVRGEHPDSRSDIFAYGALVYELATGSRAFPLEGAALNHSITHEPSPTLTLRSPIYDAMARVVLDCLQKSPPARRQRIQNAVIELRFAGHGSVRTAPAAAVKPLAPRVPLIAAKRPLEPPRNDQFFYAPGEPEARVRTEPVPTWRVTLQESTLNLKSFNLRLWGIAAACIVVLVLSVMTATAYFRRGKAGPVLQFSVQAPENTTYPGTPSVSPDGKLLVFSAIGPEGRRTLWLRPLDALRSTPIAGTDGGSNPFWSPDSQFIGYFANRTLRTVRLKDGATQTVCRAEGMNGGGTWNSDGLIVFAPSLDDGLYSVSARGGTAAPLLKLVATKNEQSYLWPQFLPDGKHFVFFVLTDNKDTTGVYSGSVSPADYRMLFPSETNAVFSTVADDSSKNGFLLFISGRNLMGQAFNPGRLNIIGQPIKLAEDIGPVRSLSLSPVSVSSNSTLIYPTGGKPSRQMVWMDRSGTQTTAVLEGGEWGPPRIAADGNRAVAGKLGRDGQSADLFLIELNGNLTQLTDTPVHEGSPVWSPDSTKIASFVAGRAEGNFDLYSRRAEPGTSPELIYRSANPKFPTDWSHDGRYLLFWTGVQGTNKDVWAYSFAEHRAGPVLQTVANEDYATISPDGKWLAFESDESGRLEVYVQAWDGISSGTKRHWKISSAGGGLPHWRGDSKELYYLTGNGRMMATAVHPLNDTFDFDPPQKLFQTRPVPKTWNFYDVSPDGQRFLMNLPLEWSNSSQITVITNWTEKVKQ